MEIREFIPVILKPERPLEGVTYLENLGETDTLAEKIKRMLDTPADYYVFHHQDLKIETPEAIPLQCERMRVDGVGVAGVIGTRYMSTACAWWMHPRPVVTAGAIMQGDGHGGAYPMLEDPGYHVDLVSVDGAIMIFSREFLEKYEPHPFHPRFGYDVDSCFQCLEMGLKVATLDVRCMHESQGGFDPAEFDSYRQKFLEYWKPHVDFPVISQSRFK